MTCLKILNILLYYAITMDKRQLTSHNGLCILVTRYQMTNQSVSSSPGTLMGNEPLSHAKKSLCTLLKSITNQGTKKAATAKPERYVCIAREHSELRHLESCKCQTISWKKEKKKKRDSEAKRMNLHVHCWLDITTTKKQKALYHSATKYFIRSGKKSLSHNKTS